MIIFIKAVRIPVPEHQQAPKKYGHPGGPAGDAEIPIKISVTKDENWLVIRRQPQAPPARRVARAKRSPRKGVPRGARRRSTRL